MPLRLLKTLLITAVLCPGTALANTPAVHSSQKLPLHPVTVRKRNAYKVIQQRLVHQYAVRLLTASQW